MYGITADDRNYHDEMLKKQKMYLDNNDYSTMSANLVPEKFIAELNNRIDSLVNIAKNDKCIPVFITITAPSRFHPKSEEYNEANVHDTMLYLSIIWVKLLRVNVMKRIKKDGFNRHYVRVFEPMESGVPHIHALFFLPRKYLIDFKKAYYLLLDKELIRTRKSFIFQFKKAGYENNFDGARAYMTKYLTKTFKDSKSGKMSDVVYWYIKHSVRRFQMSRTNAPLAVFRKINYLKKFQSMHDVTKHFKSGQLHWSGKKGYLIHHFFNEEELMWDDEHLWMKPIDEKKIREFLNRKPMKLKVPVPVPEPPVFIPVFDGNNNFIGCVDDSYTYKKTPYKKASYDQYGDLELYDLIKYLEHQIDSNKDVDLIKFGVFKEEAKRRGLFEGEPIKIDEYNIDSLF